MTSIKSFFRTIAVFIFKSSNDPRATSATIKFALVGIIPYLMQATDIVCQFGYQCVTLNPSLVELFFDSVSETIFYSLTLVAVLGSAYGFLRKIIRTAMGVNKAIQ